jgi:AbrB family looped-hinge helix DNA binding protein
VALHHYLGQRAQKLQLDLELRPPFVRNLSLWIPYEKYEKDAMKEAHGVTDCFYGASTVGERGQIVIPAEARAALGIHPGDKILILRHPAHKGLMVFKIDAAKEFLSEFAAMIDGAEAQTEGAKVELAG